MPLNVFTKRDFTNFVKSDAIFKFHLLISLPKALATDVTMFLFYDGVIRVCCTLMRLNLSSNLLSHAYVWHATKYINTIAFTDMYHIQKSSSACTEYHG